MKSAFKWKRFFKSTLFEYFYYLLLVAFSVTVILGGSLYFYFSKILRSEAIQSNNNILTQLKNSQEAILSEVDKSFANIVLDPFFISYMDYSRSRDMPILLSIQSKLQNVISLNGYIDSIFIYFYDHEFILSSSEGDMPVANFSDKDFVKQTLGNGISESFVVSREIPEYLSKNKITVLSFVKPMPINTMEKPIAAVVINVKGEYLQKTIDSIKTKQPSEVFILTEEGNVLSRKTGSAAFTAENIADYISDGKSYTAAWDIKPVDGRKMLITTLDSEKYKWKYVYLVPLTAITSSIRFLGLSTIIFCIFVILLGVIGSFYISKKIYSPIGTILSMLGINDKGKDGKTLEKVKDTVLIRENISYLIDKTKNLEELTQEYKIFQKNKFLMELLENSRPTENVSERFAYYGIEIDPEGYFAACSISMDNYKEFYEQYSEKQKNMLYIFISENLAGTILKDYKGFIVENNANEIIVFINFSKDADIASITDFLHTLAKDVHSELADNLRQTFTLGVSSPRKGIRNLSQCYSEAVSALNCRLLFGDNQIISYESLGAKGKKSILYPYSIEKEILDCVKSGDIRRVAKALEAFKEYLFTNLKDDTELIRYYFLQLLSASIKCIYEIDKNFTGIPLTHKEVYIDLLKEETMHGMVLYIHGIYKAFLETVQTKREAKNKELIDDIMKYIQGHFVDELSIEAIADRFFLSASHLRKIFKEETSFTLKEYIDSVRMARAKELLENPVIKIHDIAPQVGYLSSQAFIKAFKQYTGSTPGDYRAKNLRGDKADI